MKVQEGDLEVWAKIRMLNNISEDSQRANESKDNHNNLPTENLSQPEKGSEYPPRINADKETISASSSPANSPNNTQPIDSNKDQQLSTPQMVLGYIFLFGIPIAVLGYLAYVIPSIWNVGKQLVVFIKKA